MRIQFSVDGKELDLELENPTEFERLMIISNVFQMMGLRDDISQIIDDYIKIGKYYDEFHRNVKPQEPTKKKQVDLELKYSKSESQPVDIGKPENNDEPTYFRTGVVKDDNGLKKYKCRLHCTCQNRTNVYIVQNAKIVTCMQCHKIHEVRNAKKDGFPNRDDWGNYFIAGEFIGEDEKAMI